MSSTGDTMDPGSAGDSTEHLETGSDLVVLADDLEHDLEPNLEHDLEPGGETAEVAPVPRRQRVSQRTGRVLASMAIAIGLLCVAIGISYSVTGRDAQNLPDQIQNINPVRNATQVLSQERIEVDLIDGYTGVFVINGVLLETFDTEFLDAVVPGEGGQQVSLPKTAIFEKGNYTLTFTPVDGAPIEKFATGINTVEVRYWKLIDGPNAARSFTWQFDVI